jgi:Aspartyl protease/PDZ domain
MRQSLVLVLAALCAVVPPAARAAEPADALLARARAALGGGALDKLQGLHVSGGLLVIGIKGTQEQWIDVTAGTYAESADAGPASGADGYDGSDAWVRDASGIVHVDASVSARMQAMDQAYLSTYRLFRADRAGATVASAPDRTEGGVAYEVLHVTPAGGVPFEVWFDQKTALPSKMVAAVGGQTVTVTFSDYRRVAGIMFPFTQDAQTGDGNSSAFSVAHVEVDPAGVAERVRKPRSSADDFSIAGAASSTTVPVELQANHVYLSVRLNGKGPYRFIFDTGGANIVDPAVAKEIGLRGIGSAQVNGVGNDTESIQAGKVDSLEIGDARLVDQYFAVLPTRAGFGVAEGGTVDGLIGFEVLARYLTTFDYQRRQVTLRLPTEAAGTEAGAPIPFVFEGETPAVTGAIDGVAAELTVDTGSRASISVYKPFADAHPQIVPPDLSAPGVSGFGVGGAAMGRLGRITTLRIGTYTVGDLVADFSIQEKGSFANPYVAANVGGGVWKRFTVTFDYPHQIMRLRPNVGFAVREVYDRSGMFLIVRKGLTDVLDVRAGTPAAQAGVRKGDVVVSVDGKAASTLSISSIRELLMAAPGTRVLMTLQSNGTSRDVVVTLRDYV